MKILSKNKLFIYFYIYFTGNQNYSQLCSNYDEVMRSTSSDTASVFINIII